MLVELKIVQKEAGDRKATLDNISETMLSRKNPFWSALERLFTATEGFTISRKILLGAQEFLALFSFHNSPEETPSIQPAIASLRLTHYIAAAFGKVVGNLNKEVIFIVRNGRRIIPLILIDNDCQNYNPPVFIGISVEMSA